MDHHVSTIKPRRIQNQNVIHRLERRRISSGRAGTHWHQVRVFHQNVFPNFTVVNVEKPPCFLRKFSPDGRYFIAFSSDQTSLEIYEYQGCQAAEDLLQGYEGEILSNGNDQRSVSIRGRLFERFFVLLHITNVAANGEHLNRECSLFTDDCRCVIVGSAAYLPDEPHPPFYEVYRNSESVTPNPRSPLEDYSLHIIDLHTGRLCDTRTFKCDKVVLSHNQGLYLYKNILAILSVQQQTIHVFQVTPEGTFIDVRTIGRFCYEDDLLTVSAVFPEVQRDSQTGMANPFRDPFINSLKHRLLVYLWRRAEQDGSAMAKRRFFQYFDQLRQLRMWKMQLLDENHLFIKYTSEDVVTLRVTDPSQASFFVVYNMVTTEVIAVFENTSDELLELFENFCDLFRNATLHSEVQFPCSASSNNFARQIQRRLFSPVWPQHHLHLCACVRQSQALGDITSVLLPEALLSDSSLQVAWSQFTGTLCSGSLPVPRISDCALCAGTRAPLQGPRMQMTDMCHRTQISWGMVDVTCSCAHPEFHTTDLQLSVGFRKPPPPHPASAPKATGELRLFPPGHDSGRGPDCDHQWFLPPRLRPCQGPSPDLRLKRGSCF
uniref:DET1 partner of COP1 E3 ubiquitin ligase n=1 Tax=Rattus norvegicus TaxID=10116 RepID=A0ABK0L731_RAT